MSTSSKIAVTIIRNKATSAYEATCPYCKKLVFSSLTLPAQTTVLHICDTPDIKLAISH